MKQEENYIITSDGQGGYSVSTLVGYGKINGNQKESMLRDFSAKTLEEVFSKLEAIKFNDLKSIKDDILKLAL